MEVVEDGEEEVAVEAALVDGEEEVAMEGEEDGEVEAAEETVEAAVSVGGVLDGEEEVSVEVVVVGEVLVIGGGEGTMGVAVVGEEDSQDRSQQQMSFMMFN